MLVTNGTMAYARIYNRQEVATVTKLLAAKGVRWYCSDCAEDTNTLAAVVDKQMQLFNHKAAQQLNNIKQIVKSISDNYKCKAEFESKWSDVLKKNTETIKQRHPYNATVNNAVSEKSPMKEEENRKLHAIVIGSVREDGKTAIEQIQDLMKGECFTINNKPVQVMRFRRKNESVPSKLNFKMNNPS